MVTADLFAVAVLAVAVVEFLVAVDAFHAAAADLALAEALLLVVVAAHAAAVQVDAAAEWFLAD